MLRPKDIHSDGCSLSQTGIRHVISQGLSKSPLKPMERLPLTSMSFRSGHYCRRQAIFSENVMFVRFIKIICVSFSVPKYLIRMNKPARKLSVVNFVHNPGLFCMISDPPNKNISFDCGSFLRSYIFQTQLFCHYLAE